MFAPGEVIADRYEIVRALDAGAMGEVFEALHRTLHRRVALKVLRPELGVTDESMERFSREAQAAAAIGHPNIVDVFDLGIHDGRPFLVMELLDGESLLQRTRGPYPVTVEVAVRVTGQVLSALASAHSLGVIHRDVKPENVFVLSGAELRVKLLDFGVSKFALTQGGHRAPTREGMVLGTPRYIAPEQWLDARAVDHRADLFSVGVLLYELLTGCFPYPGDDDSEIFRGLVAQTIEPVPPSALRPDLPRGIDAVVLRAIEALPAMRYPSAQDFLDALQPFGAAGIEVTDAPPSSRTIPPPAPLSLPGTEPAVTSPSRAPLVGSARPSRLRSAAWLLIGTVVGASLAAFVRPSPPPPPAGSEVRRVVAPAPRTVHIRLADLPEGATVRLGGTERDGAGFDVAWGGTPVMLEVARGEWVRRFSLVPDRDHTVVFGAPEPVAAPPEPAPPAPRPGNHQHRRRQR